MQQRIAHYEIIERIAAGGMATVYRARDTRLGRIVALKVMHPHLATDATFVERFLREARTAASLSHPNVAVIHEVGEENDAHYIAMEYLPSALDKLIENRGPLTWEEARPIVLEITAGLRAADRQGIVHRDLKPQNILLDEDGHAKVADFGIARAAEFGTMTATGVVLGTPQYMSPEQARGERVDIRADLYALGVMTYQMLTGHTPLEAQTPQDVMRHHLRETPTPLELLDSSGLPDVAARLIRRLVTMQPNDRFQTPQEVIDFIDAAPTAQPQPQVSPPPSVSAGSKAEGPPSHDSRAASESKNLKAGIAAVAVIGIIIAGVVAFAVFPENSDDPILVIGPTAVPTWTPEPTWTPAPTWTPELEPTRTPIPPSPTRTPILPTATHTPIAPTLSPTATPTPSALAIPVTYVIDTWVLEDSKYELRVSETEAQFGYAPGERPTSTDADGIVMTFNVGDTLLIPTMRISGSRGTVPNAFRIPELGIDYRFLVGGVSLSNVEITWLKAGTFQIVGPEGSDNGSAIVVVKGLSQEHLLDRFQIEDGLFELRVGAAGAFGYAADARIYSTEGDGIVMTIKLGDTITFTELRTSSSRSTKNHHFTITELGIDEELDPGERYGFSFTPHRTGTFTIFDSSDPRAHGNAQLVVE